MRAGALVLASCVARAAALSLRPAARVLKHFSKVRPAGLWDDASAPVYDGAKPLSCLVWNIQYGAGIRQHFFYDGGDAVSTPRAEVESYVGRIGDAIVDLDPDVVLLQEVDRRSRRTHYIDEFEVLREKLGRNGLTSCASAAYWRVPYVPHPKNEHVGRIGMHLATFSKYRLAGATRWQLPLLKESRVRRLFNLRRAALATPLAGTSGVSLVNTHLSAFSFGDGTVEAQVARLRGAVAAAQPRNWLLAGDFNSLTPSEDAAALAPDEAALYPEDASPVAPLYDGSCAALWGQADRLDTYKPWTSPAPDRTIDHAFAAAHAVFADAAVAETDGYLSDHQPVCFSVAFK
mmetsp:Transcript_4923/g.14581  ORF Transcript_4923/g.14581 Transcript_4923/m.14581 type:complete len:347 (-) Transcript_4923:22-1062(-)